MFSQECRSGHRVSLSICSPKKGPQGREPLPLTGPEDRVGCSLTTPSEQPARHLLKLQLRRSVSVLTWVRELWLCSAPWLLTGFCSQQGKGWPAYPTEHRRGNTPAPRNTKTQSARQPHPRRTPLKHPTQQTHGIYTYETLPRLIPHDPCVNTWKSKHAAFQNAANTRSP